MDFDKQNPENVWTPFRKGSLVMDFSWSCWNVVASKPSLSWPRTGPGLYNILAQECLKIMLYPIVFESGTLYLSVFFWGFTMVYLFFGDIYIYIEGLDWHDDGLASCLFFFSKLGVTLAKRGDHSATQRLHAKKNMVGIHQNQCSPVRSENWCHETVTRLHTYMADLGTFGTIPFPFEWLQHQPWKPIRLSFASKDLICSWCTSFLPLLISIPIFAVQYVAWPMRQKNRGARRDFFQFLVKSDHQIAKVGETWWCDVVRKAQDYTTRGVGCDRRLRNIK